MKRYNVFYFIKEAVLGMLRNGVMSFASITVLMSLLVVIGGFALLVLNIDLNLNSFGDMNKIVAFCDHELTEGEIREVEEKINKLDNIESVVRITKEQGLADMKEEYEDLYDDVTEEENPLVDSFEITYISTEKVPELDYQLKQIEGIKKVNNRLDLATTIENFKQGVMIVCIVYLAILGVVSVFIIINTIRLSVFARREEISIMRYIGATGWFISLPFIIEGIIIGLISSVIAYFAEWYIYSYIESMIMSDLQMLSIIEFGDLKSLVLVAFIGIGVLMGVLGSSLSLGKYLKEKE